LKIGIISDKYHLEHKLLELLKYLRSKAEISLYIEESYLLNCSSFKFDEDLFFVKGKGDLILALVKLIEKETSIPVINSHGAIWLAINRFMNCMILKREGILVPEFTLNPHGIPPHFEDFIMKNIIDQKRYTFSPKIEKKNGRLHIFDERALNEKTKYQYFFYQKFIKSKWEYKVYGICNQLYFYKQLPTLVNPNKMESRKKIEEIKELREMSLKAMKALNLELASIDFLKSKDSKYYLTDINSSPNFNYIKNGPKIVGDFILERARN